jgi:hypothetical protein
VPKKPQTNLQNQSSKDMAQKEPKQNGCSEDNTNKTKAPETKETKVETKKNHLQVWILELGLCAVQTPKLTVHLKFNEIEICRHE